MISDKIISDSEVPYVIEGCKHSDERGTIFFVNDFQLDDIKRFYIIKHNQVETIRAWQAHKIESKYFFVLRGKFTINTVKIDNWDNPDKQSKVSEFSLFEENRNVLVLPGGYASGIINNDENSELLVFSSLNLSDSKLDDYRYELNYFENCKWPKN